MKHVLCSTVLAVLSLLLTAVAQTTSNNSPAQAPATQTAATATAVAQVPRLVKFSGTVQNFNADEARGALAARDGAVASSAPTSVVGMTFSLYAQQTGGVPLWSEVQNVRVDQTGHYTVQLGSTQPDGLPVELFNSAEAQWLGVREEGQAEQPRIMLLSVPYALKAADAETLGGKPPSAYMSASNSGVGATGIGATLGRNGKQPPQVGGEGTTDYVPLWTSDSDLGDSVIYQSSNNIGIGTTSPGYPLTVSGNNTGTVMSVIQAGSGVGVDAYSYSTSGGGTAVYGKSQGASGIGVRGDALATTGTTTGIYGTAQSETGTGVFGFAAATTGTATGAVGLSASSEGIGVRGAASAETGNTVGVGGGSQSPDGVGVYGSASATSGSNNGVYGESESTAGVGVYGNSSATSGDTTGVYGAIQSPDGDAVYGEADVTTGNAAGVRGTSAAESGFGVYGDATDTEGEVYGVKGTTESPEGSGVWGENTGESGNAYGVMGTTDSEDGTAVLGMANAATGTTVGVTGDSASSEGIGVLGAVASETGNTAGVKGGSQSTDGVGVFGLATATEGENIGTLGQTASSDGIGVEGAAMSETGDTYGVSGTVTSTEGVGVYGQGVAASDTGGTVSDRPVGAWGDTNQDGGIGVLGTADDALAMAGYNKAASIATASFTNDETTNVGSPVIVAHGPNYGGVCLMDVSGDLACNGSKSAVVPVDGGARQVALYAVEAPENWFEDAGSARLSHGAAVVRLEPTFAQTVNGDIEYHVFLTPKGDCKGLYVTNETAESFEVRELGRGTANIAFDYRIMARRKGYENIRLADNTERFRALSMEHRTTLARAPLVPKRMPHTVVRVPRVGRGSRPAKHHNPPHLNKVKVERSAENLLPNPR